MKIYRLFEGASVLIFDIDSTLYTCPDYAKEQIESQIRCFASFRGIKQEQARTLVSCFRQEWAKTHGGQQLSLGNLLTHFGISIEQSIEWRKKAIDPAAFLRADSRLFDTLSELKKRFYLMCVTNNPVFTARRTLEVLGISSLVPKIIGLDSTLKSKPAREIFELALKTASADLGQELDFCRCVSIGDRYDVDLALPLELGMGGILVDGVEDVYQLPEVL